MGRGFLIVIIIIAVWVLASCIRIVPQAYAVILERLGAYQATWSTEFTSKFPFIERKWPEGKSEGTGSGFSTAASYQKDNVTIQIDTVVFFRITDRSFIPME